MANIRTVFFVGLAIALIILAAVSFSDNSTESVKTNKRNTSIEGDNISFRATPPIPTTIIATPMPTIKIVTSTPLPEPTMKERPEISIIGPENVSEGDKFVLEFQINPKSEKIVGLGIDIVFDGKLIEAKKVDILDTDVENIAIPGNIGDGIITDIVIAKREGIPSKFMAVEFAAIGSGKTNIEAKITVVNEDFSTAEITAVKTIKIIG